MTTLWRPIYYQYFAICSRKKRVEFVMVTSSRLLDNITVKFKTWSDTKMLNALSTYGYFNVDHNIFGWEEELKKTCNFVYLNQ